MSDYDQLKHYMSISDQRVCAMISCLSPLQWHAFKEAFDKLQNFEDTLLNLRRAVFIARSYPLDEPKNG